MTTMKTRIVIFAAAVAATAAGFGGCEAQPNAGCPVATSNPAYGLPPYWVKYSKVSSTGACDTLKGEGIGFQKYNTPGTKEIRLSYAIEGLGGPYSEGRIDPNDVEGKNIVGLGDLTPIPNTEGYCVVSNFRGVGDAGAPSQRFEEIPAVPLKDGGSEPAIPELFLRYEFEELKFLATVNAPGTLFTGKIKRTEDTCTATFDAIGLWPQIHCDPTANEANGYNVDCDPNPNVDAGHIIGSGINPTFQTKDKPITCGTSGNCEIQLTVQEIAKL